MSIYAIHMLIIDFALGYLAGSIPFGVIFSRLFKLGNLRQIGSGNIGATNVLRTGNKSAAILTLLCDAVKGALAITLLQQLNNWHLPVDYQPYTIALGAVFGHIYPIWLYFKGGKGVATVAGCTLALNIWVGLILIVTWVLMFIIKRVSSLSAIVTTVSAPFIALLCRDMYLTYWFAVISPLILCTHRSNIKRLLQKKEIGLNNDFGKK